MARVVFVDDDAATVDRIATVLRLHRHEAANALTGLDGLSLIKAKRPDIAFVTLVLPDMSGIDVARTARLVSPATACVIMGDHATFDAAIEALRAGICDWITRPVFEDDVVAAIRQILVTRHTARETPIELAPTKPHALSRLADAAVAFIGSAADTPTLSGLGRAIGHAPGCLRNWCRTANIEAKGPDRN